MGILFAIAEFFVFVLYGIFGYRKDVVISNLKSSFPEKSDAEISKIARAFYTHFGHILAEGIKGFTISKEELLTRYRFTNPELVEEMYQQKRSVILVSGHQNNWEFLVQSLNLQFSHQGVGVGKPITNAGFGTLMFNSRTRFGMKIWDFKKVKHIFKEAMEAKELFACMLLADQSPSNHKNSFWMNFLNQGTPKLFGPEYLAKKYNVPIFYFEVLKVKRGFYEATLVPVSYNPETETYGDITFKHNKLLEDSIRKNPSQWLWSHKKWKHAKHATDFEVRE